MKRLVDEAATRRAGARLGRALRGGDVVCLEGPLGAGKTTWVQGMLAGRGYRRPVTSPTFALVHEYRSRGLRICHMDLYRLGAAELENLGLGEYLAGPATACVIEWPEAAKAALPADRLDIRLAYPRSGPASAGRRLACRARGPASRALLRRAGLG